MTDTNAVIAVYDNHSAAEVAVKELQKSGFDMKKLSVVGKDYHTDEQVVGYYNAGDRMKYWGKWGAFWGRILGLAVWRRILLGARDRPCCWLARDEPLLSARIGASFLTKLFRHAYPGGSQFRILGTPSSRRPILASLI